MVFNIIRVPNITNICYGRDVGYVIENIFRKDRIYIRNRN